MKLIQCGMLSLFDKTFTTFEYDRQTACLIKNVSQISNTNKKTRTKRVFLSGI